MQRLNIGLDLDGVLCDFMGAYEERFNTEQHPERLVSLTITKNCQRVLKTEREFWLGLPVLNRPDFTPKLYCTERVNAKAWSMGWLERNDMPEAPLYQVFGNTGKKSPRIKGRVDVFIDDSVSNFIELNMAGIPCLLFNSEANQDWGLEGRIWSLDYDTIEREYQVFMEKVFPFFKQIVEFKKEVAERLY